MRSGENEDDIVLAISKSKNDTIFLYRCGCRTRRLRRRKSAGWKWGRVLCFEHEQMEKKSPELLEAYFAGLMKAHRTAIGN